MHNAESPSTSSSPRASHDDFRAKPKDRFEKLAGWRIDPSLINFPKGGPKFSGGNATVSQGFLASLQSDKATGQSDIGSGHEIVNSEGLNVHIKSDNRVSISGDDDECQKGEEKNERAKPKSEDANKEQEPGSNGENTGRLSRKKVAVKKMKISGDPGRVLGLALREAEFLAHLSHPNIIKLEGFVEDLSKEVIWLVLPWEEYGTLRDFIASADWDVPERISLIIDVAVGVEHLHNQEPPLYHGDLKATNILVSSKCRAIITDFGTARHLIAEGLHVEGEQAELESFPESQPAASLEVSFDSSADTITITRNNHYTLRWAAPEVLKDDETSLGSDIRSFGWVAYEVMTNSIPFQDDRDTVVIARVLMGDLPRITDDARMSLIQALCSLMMKCWKINPEQRPTAEYCRKSIGWMPRVVPNPGRISNAADSENRSPELLLNLGLMHMIQSDFSNGSRSFTDALRHCTSTDQGEKALALAGLAQAHGFHNEYSQADSLYVQALEIVSETNDRNGKAVILWLRAEAHGTRREYSEAIALYSEALEIWTDTGSKHERASALCGLATVYRNRLDYTKAITFYSEALEIYNHSDLREDPGRIQVLVGLAHVYRAQGEYSQAIAFFSEALQIRTDNGDKRGRAFVLAGIADVHRRQNEHIQAVSFYSEAVQIYTDIGDKRGRGHVLLGLAEVRRDCREYTEAVKLYSEVIQIRTEIDDVQGRVDAQMDLAYVHLLRSEPKEAIALYTEAVEISTEAGYAKGRANAIWALAEGLWACKLHSQAVGLYAEAVHIRADINDKRGNTRALWFRAMAHRLRSEYDQARACYFEIMRDCVKGPQNQTRPALRQLIASHCNTLKTLNDMDFSPPITWSPRDILFYIRWHLLSYFTPGVVIFVSFVLRLTDQSPSNPRP